ncbi:TVP38/TMEM64 family protein [Ellagibacter isourolithinifaciens]|uniref:TVP38/TMEM64 family protein n=1 Tax=Ellagibacter isourolithinifaciens TaxID=2137581 RepID=UPI003AB07AB2
MSNGSISLKNPQVKASSGGKGAQVETPARPERASEHCETVKERAHERREAAREKAQEVTTVRGREMTRGDIFKFGGLIAFFALMVIVVILIWPYIHEAFEPGGLSRVIDDVRNAGPLGFLILLAMQFMQIVVAFIPGEVVQMAAGMMYGPWLGAAVVLLGCIISSAFVFAVVHRLGAPFVRDMVPTKYLDKFNAFEESGKLSIVVFILFLIPAMPKDTFTYLVPLTNMRMRDFLVLSNVGRIPGIVISTYAANGLVDGNITQSIIIFAVVAVIAIVAIVFRDKIMNLFHHDKGEND